MITFSIFNQTDSKVILALFDGDKPLQDIQPGGHSLITRIKITLSSGAVIDSNTNAAAFDFTNTDKIILKLGFCGIPAGNYYARLRVYDPDSPHGQIWGSEHIRLIFEDA